MYNVIYFDLFTIESKREEIFCIIPKFHDMLKGLSLQESWLYNCEKVAPGKSTTLGYAGEKKIQE
jgi:hypothetical protein